MRRLLASLFLLASLAGFGQILAGDPTTEVPVAYCLIQEGQSNGEGAAQSERIANTLWNYKGIRAGYPATRTTEEQYVVDPDGVHIYNKSAAQGADLFLDNGVWEPYEMGVNSRNVVGASSGVLFGVEGFLAQLIHDRTGAPVCIIKPTFPGVGLLPTTLNTPPGPYNNVARTIAGQAYIQRAVRDFAAYMPGYRLQVVNIMWWQGESDANVGVTGAQYVPELDKFYTYTNSILEGSFVIPTGKEPIWSICKLDFYRTAEEADINTSMQAWVSSHTNAYWIDDHFGKSLQKDELTTAQDDPLTKGTPNASGVNDNDHTNYIGLQIVAEEIMENLISSGRIP